MWKEIAGCIWKEENRVNTINTIRNVTRTVAVMKGMTDMRGTAARL
jgi:hypothetical protein